jgi:Cu-Zn family superoxide dismutase
MRTRSTGTKRSPSRKVGRAALATVALTGAGSLAITSGSASGSGWEANAVIRDTLGQKVGTVKFEGDEGGTAVKVSLENVGVGRDLYHGFHLHANDAGAACDPAAPSGPFTTVGGHWNPGGVNHGEHAGDLPSVLVLGDGTVNARSVTGRFDPSEIAGRAVILHAGPDNFANIPTRYVAAGVAGPDAASYATGDAGVRIACGIIELD